MLWFGGSSVHERLLRRLVRYGDGFNPLGSPSSEELARLRAAMLEAGRGPDELEMVGGIRGTFPDDDSVADLAPRGRGDSRTGRTRVHLDLLQADPVHRRPCRRRAAVREIVRRVAALDGLADQPADPGGASRLRLGRAAAVLARRARPTGAGSRSIGTTDSDLCIVGGGFTGLWAALHAKAGDPGRDVVVLEGETCGFGASGRNGGFANASLTHGLENGLARFADELVELERLGRENLDGLVADLTRLGIECELERTGELTVVLHPALLEELDEAAALHRRFGYDVSALDAAATRAEIASPTYHGGLLQRAGSALVHPGKLALGLRRAALDAGVRLFEHTSASDLRDGASGVELIAPQGRVRARKVILATSAFLPCFARCAATSLLCTTTRW